MSLDRERFMATTYGCTRATGSDTGLGNEAPHRVAHDHTMITYGDRCDEMAIARCALHLEPHSTAVAGLLGQVNCWTTKTGSR